MDSRLFKQFLDNIADKIAILEEANFVEPFEGSFRVYGTERYGGITDKRCGFLYGRIDGDIRLTGQNLRACAGFTSYEYDVPFILVAGAYDVDFIDFMRLVSDVATFAKPDGVRRVVLRSLVGNYEEAIKGEWTGLKEKRGLTVVKVNLSLNLLRGNNECCEPNNECAPLNYTIVNIPT